MRAFALAALMALTACSDPPAWKDGTGQGRGRDELRADEIACIKEVDAWQNATGIVLTVDGIVQRRGLCLIQRGWVQNSN